MTYSVTTIKMKVEFYKLIPERVWDFLKIIDLAIGLHHPLDGVPNSEYKLLCFIQLIKYFCKDQKARAFNRDRCCHLALCLQLILFHYPTKYARYRLVFDMYHLVSFSKHYLTTKISIKARLNLQSSSQKCP